MNALMVLKSDHDHIRWILGHLEQGVSGEISLNKTDYIGWLDLLAGVLEEHIKQEERYLFKFLEQVIRNGMKNYHTDRDHEEIHYTIQILKGILHQGGPIPQKDITFYGSRLADLLKEHMTFEENVIFPRAEKELGSILLQALTPFMIASN